MSHHDEKTEGHEHKKNDHGEGCECNECQDDRSMDFAKQLVGAMTSREAQRHFIRAGVELAMGVESIVRNLPMPDQVKKASDMTNDYVQFIIEEAFCAHNPYCKHREGDGLKKVDLG